MANYYDLIKYENEGIFLDFKAIQYEKGQHEALIKDIMSMANADVKNDRYIIVGVKHEASGKKEILNIEKRDFKDPALYQQIVRENIEGDLKIDYIPFEYEGELLGIIRVYGCYDKPYVMKKDFRGLKKGDSFIRKGTHVSKMIRRDFDGIYQRKMTRDRFDGKVQLSFSKHAGSPREIELATTAWVELPSGIAAKRIKSIIKKKTELSNNKTQSTAQAGVAAYLASQQDLAKGLQRIANPLAPIPYEQRSLDELEKDLAEVYRTYHDADCHQAFELNCHKINIIVLNEGQKYIEDASIRLQCENLEGLIIAERVYEKPKDDIFNVTISASVPSYESVNYPEVTYTESSIIIFQTIGDVKHRIPTNAFRVPIRVKLLDELSGRVIPIRCEILGKNLAEPLKETLKIIGVPTTTGT